MPSNRATEIQALAMQALEAAMVLELKLSEDESSYTPQYVAAKLARVSRIQEQLSDSQMMLTKISLETTRQTTELGILYHRQQSELKASETYKTTSRDQKTAWVENQLQAAHQTLKEWQHTHEVVSEVRTAVAERMKVMNRLDSDLRLHHRLLEGRHTPHGAMPTQMPPGNTQDIDLG